MKSLSFLTIILIFYSSKIFSQSVCNPAGNIIIYSNYDGGELNINIDENIPDKSLSAGIYLFEIIAGGMKTQIQKFIIE